VSVYDILSLYSKYSLRWGYRVLSLSLSNHIIVTQLNTDTIYSHQLGLRLVSVQSDLIVGFPTVGTVQTQFGMFVALGLE